MNVMTVILGGVGKNGTQGIKAIFNTGAVLLREMGKRASSLACFEQQLT